MSDQETNRGDCGVCAVAGAYEDLKMLLKEPEQDRGPEWNKIVLSEARRIIAATDAVYAVAAA